MTDMIFLIGMLIVATVTDLRRYRIPNWCVGLGAIAGCGIAFWQGGAYALAVALAQMAIVFVLFYPFYLLRGLGAGDVKLLMVLGCYLDGTQLEKCIVLSMLLAAVIAVVKLLCKPEARGNLRRLGGCVRKYVLTGAWDGYAPVMTGAGVVRLAPSVLASVLLMLGGQRL